MLLDILGRSIWSSGVLFIQSYVQKYSVIRFLFIRSSGFSLMSPTPKEGKRERQTREKNEKTEKK